jgi:hypothetical protein
MKLFFAARSLVLALGPKLGIWLFFTTASCCVYYLNLRILIIRTFAEAFRIERNIFRQNSEFKKVFYAKPLKIKSTFENMNE